MPRHRPQGLNRRQILQWFGIGGLGMVSGCADDSTVPATTPDESKPDTIGVFRHGVASGEPLPDGIILWTRVTPDDTALPGSGHGPDVPVNWELAADEGFSDILKQGSLTASATRDHTVQVDVRGLNPAQTYWYRFSALGVSSAIGRTRTAPALDSNPEELRLGLVTCAEWEFGFFSAYRHLAERDDLDAVLHLGDYIYEFGTSYGPIASPGAAFGRVHEPPSETLTLADYRTRYGQYRSDPDLQALHVRHAMLAIYDDHEIANDWWREGAENHDPATEGAFLDRLAGGLQAFREWQPWRAPETADPSDPLRAWRPWRFGQLAEIFLLDTRLYRDQQGTNAIVGYGSVDPAIDDPNRSMLGATQKSWLFDGLSQSTAQWKILGNQVPLYPFVTGANLPQALVDALDPLDGTAPPLPAPLTVEDWNGYRAEQKQLIEHMAGIDNTIVLTGDYHESFVAEIPQSPGNYSLDGNSVGVEFICPAVTSPGLSDTLGAAGLPASQTIDLVFEANLQLANPWVRYHEGFANGFAVASIRADRAHYDFWFISDREDPEASISHAAGFIVDSGSTKVQTADGPLEPRQL